MKEDSQSQTYSAAYVRDLLVECDLQRRRADDAERREAAAHRLVRQHAAQVAEVETENRELRADNGMLRAKVRRLEDEAVVRERRMAMVEAGAAQAEALAVVAVAQAAEARAREEAAEAALVVAQAQLASAGVQVAGQKSGHPDWAKSNVPEPETEKPKRKQRPREQDGHLRRMTPTEPPVAHRLERCPCCNAPLAPGELASVHQVIEVVPPPPPSVVEHQVYKSWCSGCQRWVQPVLDLHAEAVGQGRIGVGLASFIVHLRFTMRLPVRKVQACLKSFWGIALSAGEVCGIVSRVARALKPAADAILVEARASPEVQMDETGWRVRGRNGYVWFLGTPSGLRYYFFIHSRAAKVVADLLGVAFAGVLITDFYAAYNRMGQRQQRCWVHLLRDLHALKTAYPDNVQVRLWARAVRELLYDTGAAAKAAGEGEAAYPKLIERCHRLGAVYATRADHPCRVLAQRLLDFQDQLFVFVLYPNVPPDNNLSERSVRPVVVARKISGGSRSDDGVEARMILTSLLETWTARGLNALDQCRLALTQAPRFQRQRGARPEPSLTAAA